MTLRHGIINIDRGEKTMSKIVNRETFEKMTPEVKMDVLYDQNEVICDDLSDIKKTLKRKRFIDGLCSTVGGVMGGALAIMGKVFLFK